MHSYNLTIRNRLNQLVDLSSASMANEKYSKRLIHLMDQIINCQVKYDNHIKSYDLTYDELSYLDKERLTAQLFIDMSDLAYEANGPDNDLFDRSMLSSLIVLLKNSTLKESQQDFIEAWKNGCVSYARDRLTYLMSWRIDHYNADIQFDARGY